MHIDWLKFRQWHPQAMGAHFCYTTFPSPVVMAGSLGRLVRKAGLRVTNTGFGRCISQAMLGYAEVTKKNSFLYKHEVPSRSDKSPHLIVLMSFTSSHPSREQRTEEGTPTPSCLGSDMGHITSVHSLLARTWHPSLSNHKENWERGTHGWIFRAEGCSKTWLLPSLPLPNVFLRAEIHTHTSRAIRKLSGDFPGGPLAKTLHAQGRRPGVWSLVRELDPTCHN